MEKITGKEATLLSFYIESADSYSSGYSPELLLLISESSAGIRQHGENSTNETEFLQGVEYFAEHSWPYLTKERMYWKEDRAFSFGFRLSEKDREDVVEMSKWVFDMDKLKTLAAEVWEDRVWTRNWDIGTNQTQTGTIAASH